MSFLIRQKKNDPGTWHVAAQGSDKTVEEVKMRLARQENNKFTVDKSTGDVKGDNTILSVFADKTPFEDMYTP